MLFGPGAGVLFIVAEQAVNQTVAQRRGLANGYVVSLYPLGAMLGAPVFGWSIAVFGVRPTLAGLGAAVGVACAIAAALLRAARIEMHDSASSAPQGASGHEGGRLGRTLGRTFWLLAAVFFLAASAGLTVLSQAAAIVQAYGGAAALAVGATTFITGAVGAARSGGGWLVDHFAAARVGVGAHACSLAGVVLLMLNPAPLSSACALSLIGIGYGIVSGLAAGAIAQYWHKNQFGHVAGRLYIVWYGAAVGLPVLAGACSTARGVVPRRCGWRRGSMWWACWWRGGCRRGDPVPRARLHRLPIGHLASRWQPGHVATPTLSLSKLSASEKCLALGRWR